MTALESPALLRGGGGDGAPGVVEVMPLPKRELLLGCGAQRDKRLGFPFTPEWGNLTTLDQMAEHKPDVVFDLNWTTLPFPDEEFDEIHAYEVLEHVGRQGDWRFFFAQFTDFYRILKPGGRFFGTVPLPTSVWAWGDPSHTRLFPRQVLGFLSQKSYHQIGHTAMSDFRPVYKADFELLFANDWGESLAFGLTAVKPSRLDDSSGPS